MKTWFLSAGSAALVWISSPALSQTNDVGMAEAAGAVTNPPALKVILDGARVRAKNLFEWAKKDLDRLGTWKYKVLTVKSAEATDAAVEARLNDLGKEGWDCFWVRDKGDSLTFYFKKAEKSNITEALKYRP